MPKIEPPVTPDIPQTININGNDYSIEDAQTLIETGKHTRELEEKWNTKVDNVWPEFGKLSEERKNWETERQQLQTKVQEYESKVASGRETPADTKEAQEAARQLGIVLNDDLEKAGYVKKDDLDKYFSSKWEEQKAIESILSKADSLEKTIDGSDGRPSFNKKAVMAYATAYNIPDLEKAYEDMNQGAITKWKDQQVLSQKNKGLKTLSTGGNREPKPEKVNDDNVNSLLKEALYGAE